MSPDPADDRHVWQAVREGDITALGVLFDRHAERVHAYCARSAGDVVDPEDTLSETFLEAWRSRRSFVVRDGSALPILLAIAKRVVQKQRRSDLRRRRHDLREAVRRDRESPDVAEQAVQADELERRRTWLRHQVSALPTPYRNVYELCVYGELSHDEVAHVLDIPVGTVKSRLSRARRLVTEAAPDPGDPDPGEPDPGKPEPGTPSHSAQRSLT